MRVVITSGGTEEPIDGVRSISNFSSGHTGSVIADCFKKMGAEVIYLHARDTIVSPRELIDCKTFITFKDLDNLLKEVLSANHVDVIIHLAAVSDFAVDTVQIGEEIYLGGAVEKIDSDDKIIITLKQNFKIIDHLKEYSQNNDLIVVGFKLTNSDQEEKREYPIRRLLNRKVVDFLVHNDLTQIDSNNHIATIYDRDGGVLTKVESKQQLAESLCKLVGVVK